MLIALMTFFVAFTGNANAADAQVKIANFTFEPPVLTVKVGTTATWVNDDDIPHLVSEKGRQVPLECARYRREVLADL